MLILKNINNNRTVECIVDYNFHVPKVVFGGSFRSFLHNRSVLTSKYSLKLDATRTI